VRRPRALVSRFAMDDLSIVIQWRAVLQSVIKDPSSWAPLQRRPSESRRPHSNTLVWLTRSRAAPNARTRFARLATRSRAFAAGNANTPPVLLPPLPLVAHAQRSPPSAGCFAPNAIARCARSANHAGALRRTSLGNSPADGVARPPFISLRAAVPPTVRRLRPVGGRNALRP
jgi:hypothetical protein